MTRQAKRLPHGRDISQFCLKCRPVIALGNVGPDSLDFVDHHRHRAGLLQVGLRQQRAQIVACARVQTTPHRQEAVALIKCGLRARSRPGRARLAAGRRGELLAARNFTYVNWTKGIDATTGRPIPNPQADYEDTPKLIFPSQAGAHNWQPMSYSPQTGLVYIPVIDAPMVYIDTARRPAGLVEGAFTVPGIPPEGYDPAGMRSLFGSLPSLESLARTAGARARSAGELRAWDPVRQRVVWSRPGFSVWDGGVLSTAGGLVMRGDAAGLLRIYDADTGADLHRIEVGTAMMAAPMSYRVGGEQYIAVMAGFGGGGGFAFPEGSAAYRHGNDGRIVVFKLDGGRVPLPPVVADTPVPAPPAMHTSAPQVARGEVLYNRYCGRCHVFGRGLLPDLRRMTAATHARFDDIVLRGAYVPLGMARWDDVLDAADAAAIHTYIVDQARRAAPPTRAKISAP